MRDEIWRKAVHAAIGLCVALVLVMGARTEAQSTVHAQVVAAAVRG